MAERNGKFMGSRRKNIQRTRQEHKLSEWARTGARYGLTCSRNRDGAGGAVAGRVNVLRADEAEIQPDNALQVVPSLLPSTR